MDETTHLYWHFHFLPDGRLEAVQFDGPEAQRIIGRQSVLRDGVDWSDSQKSDPCTYRCDVCRNFGNGTQTGVAWEDVQVRRFQLPPSTHNHAKADSPGT